MMTTAKKQCNFGHTAIVLCSLFTLLTACDKKEVSIPRPSATQADAGLSTARQINSHEKQASAQNQPTNAEALPPGDEHIGEEADTMKAQERLPLPPAPWEQQVASGKDYSDIYKTEWKKAENRNHCKLIVLPNNAAAHLPSAKPRRANFAGGWAVAYDTPSQRSAYGVAGSGGGKLDPTGRFPNTIHYRDGSAAGYGLEGGTGPKILSYTYVAGQDCLYNIWSMSEAHMKSILADLRSVPPL